MYGMGMLKGLGVTMKNMVLPSRMFTLHQYPTRKIGLLGLAKEAGTNVFSYTSKQPVMAVKALIAVSVPSEKVAASRSSAEVRETHLLPALGLVVSAKSHVPDTAAAVQSAESVPS